MRLWLEAPLFLALAALLHLAVFGLRAGVPGAASSGDGGTALVSIQAAPASVAAMVAAWDTPPEIADTQDVPPPTPAALAAPRPEPAAPVPAEMPDGTPALPRPEAPMRAAAPDGPVLPASPAPPDPLPEPKSTPQPDTEPIAAVADTAAPLTSPRPPERPAPPSRTADRAPQTTPQRATQSTASAPAAAQRAAGNGGSAFAGTSAPSEAATLSASQTRSLIANWGAGIRARIERRKSYPSGAGRAAGVATVALSVARDGRLLTARIARSSGHPALDDAAIGAVRRAAPFARAPSGLSEASYSFTLPIRFAP